MTEASLKATSVANAEYHAALDAAEVVMDQEFVRHDPPTTHHVVFPFYIRQIEMPQGFMCVTKVHGRRHAFCISKGRVVVKDEAGNSEVIEAPHYGITEPGTRRILFCETPVTWTTFHLSENLDVEQVVSSIEREIMIPIEHGVPIADALNRQIQKDPLLQTGEPY